MWAINFIHLTSEQSFLGKATLSIVKPVRQFCPSVRMEQLGYQWSDFRKKNFVDIIFTEICQNIPLSVKIGQTLQIFNTAHILKQGDNPKLTSIFTEASNRFSRKFRLYLSQVNYFSCQNENGHVDGAKGPFAVENKVFFCFACNIDVLWVFPSLQNARPHEDVRKI